MCLVCGGLYELLSGNYVPTGQRNGAFKRLFNLLFIQFGPVVHSLIWFVLGGTCIGIGVFSLNPSSTNAKHEKFSGQKPRIRSKK
jgi:hypothetical protein